jgi:hypothetical protein
MSAPTTTYAVGDFDDLEFGLLVADFDTEQPDPRIPRQRVNRSTAEREAIEQSLGIYRHRSAERRD